MKWKWIVAALSILCIPYTMWGQFEIGTKFECFDNDRESIVYKYNDKICYDYKVYFEGNYNGKHVYGCMLVNSEMGINISFGFDDRHQYNCDYNFNDPFFNAYMYTLKGFNYTYYNRAVPGRGREVLKHYVREGLTSSTSMERKFLDEEFELVGEIKEIGREHSYKAVKYKGKVTGTYVWFHVTAPLPSHIKVYEYLGAYGVGFANTNEGTTLILGFEDMRNNTFITDVKYLEARECFHPHMFVKDQTHLLPEMEESFSKLENDTRIKKDKISSTEPCPDLKEKFLTVKQEYAQKMKQTASKLQSESVKSNDMAHMAKMHKYDPVTIYEIMVLEDEYKICKLKLALERGIRDPKEKDEASRDLECLQRRAHEMRENINDIHAMQRSSRADKAQHLQVLYSRFREIMSRSVC